MNAMHIDAMFEAESLHFLSFGMSEADSLQFWALVVFLLLLYCQMMGDYKVTFVLLEVLAIKLTYNFLVDQSVLLVVKVFVPWTNVIERFFLR